MPKNPPIPTQIALQKAIDKVGSPTALAKIIGLSHNAQIFVMLNRDKKASAKYVLAIHQATGVPLYELRPDLYPKPIFKKETKNAQNAH